MSARVLIEKLSVESTGGPGLISLITVFSILGIRLLEFGDFRSTLVVLSVIPPDDVGRISGRTQEATKLSRYIFGRATSAGPR